MKRAVFLTLSILALVSACAAVGLTLTPFIWKKLGFKPFGQAIVQGPSDIPSLIQVIGRAKTSILVGADYIDNKSVLEALADARARKVQVEVVLSGSQSINTAAPHRGARAWLEDHRIQVAVSSSPIRGFVLVADRQMAVLCTSPILSSKRMMDDQVPLFAFDHKPTAESYYALVRSWHPQDDGSP